MMSIFFCVALDIIIYPTAPNQARMLAVSHTKPLHDAVAQMADDLYGGFAPKQGRFGCLPKVLHDAKPT